MELVNAFARSGVLVGIICLQAVGPFRSMVDPARLRRYLRRHRTCGLAAISTDCPSGPREIIRHEVDGILVPNRSSEELASAMDRLMSDLGLWRRLGQQAHDVTKRFVLETVMKMWEATLKQAISGTQP